MRRCDKCRTEYESGVDYGGKDYCMTCYIRVKDEESRKKREDDERMKRAREEAQKEIVRKRNEEYFQRKALEEKLLREKMERDAEIRKKVQEAADKKKNRKKDEDEMKKRYYYGWKPSVKPPEVPNQKWTAVDEKVHRAAALPARRPAPPDIPMAKPMGGGGEVERVHREMDEPEVNLELAAQKGLPLSLSCGQKGVRAVFVGKNPARKKITVELSVSLFDFRKNQLGVRVEPTQFTIDDGGKAIFAAEFDLRDDVATGVLTLTAQLKENAIYVDRQPVKSNVVVLESKVKTPMDLEYKKGSAAFEGGKDGAAQLCMTFYNRGESGGTLNVKSSVGYGTDAKMKRAQLVAKVKVKGMQKKVELKFAPAERVPVEKMVSELLGLDSNGKPYKGQKTVKEKIEQQKK